MKSKSLVAVSPQHVVEREELGAAQGHKHPARAVEAEIVDQSFAVFYRYRVYFTRDLFAPSNSALRDVLTLDGRQKPKLVIVAETQVLEHQPALESLIKEYVNKNQLNIAGEILRIPGGESIKQTPDAVERILDAIHLRGIDRHSYVLAIGGGALLDAVGYAAAIAHRGAYGQATGHVLEAAAAHHGAGRRGLSETADYLQHQKTAEDLPQKRFPDLPYGHWLLSKLMPKSFSTEARIRCWSRATKRRIETNPDRCRAT